MKEKNLELISSSTNYMYGLHRGYLYQDLLTAFLISENLHRKNFQIGVELKESAEDSFNDIVMIADGKKTKLQVKQSSNNQVLTQGDFTKDSSDLNLTKLEKSFSPKENVRYIVATNRNIQPNNFFVYQNKRKSFSLSNKTYSISLRKARNKKFIQRFLIEASLPDASFDLSKPGSLEKELFESLRLKVGIGYYPNNQISVRDVAGRLILLANQLRCSKKSVLIDRSYIFRYINLNFEYGHITQNFPFISSKYRLYKKQIVTKIGKLIDKHQFTVLVGPPGSGKSHIFDDLFNQLTKDTTLVARHFCYLEPTDRFAQERIVVDAMYGNFLYQLEKLEPKIAQEIRPYFAATKTNVERIIEKIADSGKRIVLMVDGLDHLNRVVAQNKLSIDLVNNFIVNLLDMKLPKGCSVFIASQPSVELKKIIQKKDASVYFLEAWNKKLVEEFVLKHNNLLPTERKLDIRTDTIKILTEKTEGNPLYLTYVLQEIVSTNSKVDFLTYSQKMPSGLSNYYKYLAKDITDSDFAVVQTLALLDFSVTRNELGEMFSPIQKRGIDMTLNKIWPILKPGMVHGGIRIYHESFRRFIIKLGHRYGQRDRELYKHITNWLEEKKGFFLSQRAYRYLIPYLIRSKEEDRIYKLLKKDFVVQSLFYFHAVESIVTNLNKIANYAAQRQRWEIYCKAVELKRALHTFSEERLDSVKEVYHQAILNVQGVNMFCERMLFEGKRVFPKTDGILLCQMAEHAGGNPPWDFYDVVGVSMQVRKESQVRYFQEVEAAHFLNLTRQSSVKEALKILHKMITKNTFPNTEQHQINILLKEFDHVFGISQNYKDLANMPLSQKKKFILHITIAEYLYKNGYKKEASRLSTEIIKKTKDISQILHGVLVGGKIGSVCISGDIIKLTEQVLKFQNLYDNEEPIFKEWYQTLRILARTKPSLVKTAKKLISNIDGWYRAWILYLFEIAQLEASSLTTAKKERLLEIALKNLNKFTHPFKGQPRAMDLYGIREWSLDSFRRTLIMAREFSNYSEILNLLSNISRRSTSYLQGSSGGPLSGETFNSLLKETYPFLGKDKKKRVKKLLEENIRDGTATSVYYDSTAFEYLKLATVLLLDKKFQKSKECLMDGCVRLAAYGHRKDVTLFEIIEPIQFIARKDLKFATKAFKKSFPLVETVWRYTDGRSTKWSLSSWLKTLINSDIKIAIQVITEMARKDPTRDWRVETGTESLCDKLLENKINAETIADLYDTIGQIKNTRIDVSVGLKIVQELLKKRKKKRAQKLFDSICNTLYWILILEYVSDKENFKKILLFAKNHKLKIKAPYLVKFEEEDKKTQASEPSLSKSKEKPPKIPGFSFSKLSVTKMHRIVDDNLSSHFLHPKNIKNLGKTLLRLESKHPNEVRNLVLSIVRRGLYSSENINGLITLRDLFRSNNKNELAAFVSMLGFVYARGGNGWYALADSKYNYLARDSFCLSKKVAQKTLASEMFYLFSKETYFVGPVRHLIEFFPSNGKIMMAKKIWKEAYGVIKFRLPTYPELDKVLANETPSFNYKRSLSINTLLGELIDARKKITS